MTRIARAFSPGSVGNVGVGFDIIGHSIAGIGDTAAVRRIDEGEYGYCAVTGEPISLARLQARPIATMTLEAQERHERNERISRED